MNYFDPSATFAARVQGAWLLESDRRAGIRGRQRAAALAVHYGYEQRGAALRRGLPGVVEDVDPRRLRQHLRHFAAAGARHGGTFRIPYADAVVEHGGRHHAHRPALQSFPRRIPGYSGFVARTADASRGEHPGAGAGDADAVFDAVELQRAAHAAGRDPAGGGVRGHARTAAIAERRGRAHA